MKIKFALAVGVALLAFPVFAGTQVVKICTPIHNTTTGQDIESCVDVNAANPLPVTSSSGTTTAPYKVTPVNLDVTSLSGSGATTVLSAGHAAAGATITASVAYCINFNGTAGSTNNTPAGTQCGGLNTGFSAGQSYSVPPTANAVSIYGLTAGTASGTGAQ